jgi:hypothetical protein
MSTAMTAHNLGKKELIAIISEAFADVERPGKEQITRHECGECDEVREDFARFSREAIPQKRLEYHASALPLLTTKALQYLLPAYLIHSLNNLESGVTEYAIFHLSPSDWGTPFWVERFSVFNSSQKAAICQYLRFLENRRESKFLEESIQSAQIIWCQHLPHQPHQP